MSRNINVNPGHYKVAGRERQGEDIIQHDQKQRYAQQPGGGRRGDVPPWEATRHNFATAQPEPEPEPDRSGKRVKPRRKAKTAKKAGKTAASRTAARKAKTTRKRPSTTTKTTRKSTKKAKRPAARAQSSRRRR